MIDLRFPRGLEEIRVISDHSTFQSSKEYAPHCIFQEFNPRFCETFFVWKDKKTFGSQIFLSGCDGREMFVPSKLL